MDKEISRINQEEKLPEILKAYKSNDMVTVYYSSMHSTDKGVSYPAIHSALIPNEVVTASLNRTNWDLMYDGGQPYVEKYMDGTTNYLRFGNDNGFEPLVISRDFLGVYKNFLEISEEFRLFYNLYYDKPSKQFLKILDDGNTEKVIVLDEESGIVKIRWKELNRFISSKGMSLAIFFDFIEYSSFAFQDLNLESGVVFEIKDDLTNISCHVSNCQGEIPKYNSLSRLLGKRVLLPSECTVEDAELNKRFIGFIVDTDDKGDEVESTCDMSKLKNLFGQNPDALSYLTPVYFRKNVLDKYYNETSKYDVTDAMLSCGSLWSIHLDNNHKDKVCVWLGDLSNLSYTEQSYWRSFNIVPDGFISPTFYRRQIQAQFVNSDQPEHVFLIVYHKLLEESKHKLGWDILLPLTKDDEHFLKSIRLPASNEQKVFDELVLSLTKVLVDSINEKEMQKVFKHFKEDATELRGSINKLKFLFDLLNLEGYEEVLTFLRGLQNLRSSSSAHRKGKQYQKVAKELGIINEGKIETFNKMLKQSIDYLTYLRLQVVEALIQFDSPRSS